MSSWHRYQVTKCKWKWKYVKQTVLSGGDLIACLSLIIALLGYGEVGTRVAYGF